MLAAYATGLRHDAHQSVCRQPPRASPAATAARLQTFAQEAARLGADTGPQGVRRTLEASQALLQLGGAYVGTVLRGGTPDAPPALLRKLFEKLGATYVKLGQFVASSPSLFPAEYVEEFQRCLDRTEPVPYAQIRRVIEQELKQPITEVCY